MISMALNDPFNGLYICDRVRGNQAFGHAIHIRVRACIVGMVYFGEFWFFA